MVSSKWQQLHHELTILIILMTNAMEVNDEFMTFRQLHGTKEAWLASSEYILEKALSRADDEAALKLRFLTPISDQTDESADFFDLLLTPLEEVPRGTRFMTLSYCWAQPAVSEELLRTTPQYRIWESHDRSGSFRVPRCPRHVLHRAFCAAHHLECPFFWIDQDCIDQSDPADIQRHLEIMHRV